MNFNKFDDIVIEIAQQLALWDGRDYRNLGSEELEKYKDKARSLIIITSKLEK